jgi:hypothetical protein
MRTSLVAMFLFAATGAHAKREISFDLPKDWKAAAAARTATAAAPVEDHVYELTPPSSLSLRGQVIVYAGKVGEGELDHAAAERHAARVKNRVAWGMRAESGPPRETLKLGGKRAVRWRDRVGSVLGQNEQLMTCLVAAGHLACVITIGPADSRDAAEHAAQTILASLRR